MLCIANIAVYKSQGEDSLKTICQKMLLELDEKLERELSRLKLGTVAREDEVVQCNTTDDMPVSDPPQARSKGVRNTRIRGHFEKRKTKPSKDASSSSEKLLLYFIFLLNICFIFITNRHFFCMISQEKHNNK
jgi:hypothetical protein